METRSLRKLAPIANDECLHSHACQERQPGPLFHARVLLLEDDYFLAFDLRNELVRRGADVLGPYGNIDLAWDLAKSVPTLDAAVVDINLNGELAFPMVDELIRRDIPVVFWSGYTPDVVPYRLRHITHVQKPAAVSSIARAVAELISDRRTKAG